MILEIPMFINILNGLSNIFPLLVNLFCLKLLLIFDIYSFISNIIKKNEEKIIYFIFIKKEITQNYLSGFVNELVEIKNFIINNNYKKNKNDNIISQRNKRKIFLIRNIKLNYIKIIKYIISLNLFNNIILNNKISLIEYKSYNITLKIKGTGIKKIFSSDIKEMLLD